MAKKTVRQQSVREWVGGRFRLPVYVENPEPLRPDAIIWMDEASRLVFTFEAIHPETSDSVLLDRFQKALNNPRVGAARRPTILRVAEARWADLLRARRES
jgi:hypothetical protein